MNSLEHPADGLEDGPAPMDSFKRAVIRPAPRKFTVEMLGAAKQGGSYSYGMRICPIASGYRRSSMSSQGSYSEYEVWRRWEDCLAFQGTLELEYRRMARQKRQRLLRGKGVKKDGFYKQDQASSWESLPPGPDPNSVARDIHEYIPLLTRKGTVFRASQATIDQRAAELKALVEGLLRDDVPALVDELKNDRIVTDFFGYWRRDQELLDKQRKQRKSGSKSRTSVTSSIFSMYFSSSNLSVQNVESYPESTSTSRRTSSTYQTNDTRPGIIPRIRKTSSDSSDGSRMGDNRRRANSTGSSNAESSTFAPSTPSERSFDSPVHTHIAVPAIADDVPTIAFDHNPDAFIGERPSSALAILPEGREMSLKTDTSPNPPPVTRRRGKSAAADSNPARNGLVFLSPPSHIIPSPTSHADDRFLAIPDRSVRDSWQTMDSASCILDGMDVTLPTSPTDQSNRASIATFMTDCTVDGVLPRPNKAYPWPSYKGHISPAKSRIVSGPVSVSEFDHDWSDPEEDILDTFLAESFPLPTFRVPETTEILPQSQPQTPYPEDEQLTPSCLHVPRSPAKSAKFSVSTTVSGPQTLTIKAGYHESLIVLRVPCEIPYKDLRQRLYNKFVGQEGVPLSDNFTISFLQPVITTPEPAPAAANVRTRKRSNSLSSDPANNTMYPVASEADWEIVAASIEGSKLELRIFDKVAS